MTCSRIATGQYQLRYPQAVFGATGPFPVIQAIGTSAVTVNPVVSSFDSGTNEWVIDYTFSDHADHLHSALAASGY